MLLRTFLFLQRSTHNNICVIKYDIDPNYYTTGIQIDVIKNLFGTIKVSIDLVFYNLCLYL